RPREERRIANCRHAPDDIQRARNQQQHTGEDPPATQFHCFTHNNLALHHTTKLVTRSLVMESSHPATVSSLASRVVATSAAVITGAWRTADTRTGSRPRPALP